MSNSTEPGTKPDLGSPQFASHEWLEPIVVLCIMIGSLIINRRRSFRIMDPQRGRSPTRSLLTSSHSSSHSPTSSSPDTEHLLSPTTHHLHDRSHPVTRTCCFLTTITTPDTTRFASNLHSRILAKFPFLMEMFYWLLNFLTYVATKAIAAQTLTRNGTVWDLAQTHGLSVMWVEHESFLRFLFPIHEVTFQTWFLSGHTGLLTFLNRIYSLVHIPGTVTFLGWYYFAAPTFTHFATVRRTMTLGNFAAFFVFAFWPCAPPRLLPKELGFHDTVRQDHAESAFVNASYVNQLAAMPSLHFTYAFVTGCTFIYHSCVLPYPFAYSKVVRGKMNRWAVTRIGFFLLGFAYPLLVLTVIVATANHYYLDAVVAMVTVSLSLCANKVWFVLLPAEDWLAWCLRLEKPRPTTGDRYCLGAEENRRSWKEGEEA